MFRSIVEVVFTKRECCHGMFPLKPISLLKVSLLEDRELLRERDGQRQRPRLASRPTANGNTVRQGPGACSLFLPSSLPLGNMRKTGSGYVAIYEVLPGIGCREGRDGMARTWLTVKDPLTSSAEHILAELGHA